MEKMEKTEKKEKKINGLQLRILISTLLFLAFFALYQVPETKNWLNTSGIFEQMKSFEDIYTLEDKGILWYNSLANEIK